MFVAADTVNVVAYAPLIVSVLAALLATPVPPYVGPTTVPCHTPVPIVPTVVRLELVTPDPNVDADRTDVLLILNTLPVAMFQFSLDVQFVLARSQLIVLSVAPLRVIPPPSAVLSVGDATLPISIFLSSTWTVVDSM